MSFLSCIKKEFLQYLYDNNIKIHTCENTYDVCDSYNIRGYFYF